RLTRGARGRPEVELELAFRADLPLPPWRWFTGVPVRDPELALAQVRQEVEAFRTQFLAKDLDGIVAMLKLRDEDAARPAYQPPEAQRAVTREEFEEMLNGPAIPLAAFAPGDLQLQIFGGGRLVRLDRADGEAPLRLEEPELSMVTYLPLVFYQPSQ